MGIFPGPLIAGPEPLSRRYGLLSAAAGPLDLETHGKGGGYRYVPVTCGDAHTYAIDCSGGFVEHHSKSGDGENAEVETGAFIAYASLLCGSVGYTAAEFKTKVERRLLNGEQGAIEHALWTGRSSDGTPLGIENLQDSGVDVGASSDENLSDALAALEDWAYHIQGYGNVAYIHAPVRVAAYAGARFLVIRDGNILRTPFGSVWVFGGGYPETGPGGVAPPLGGSYLYVTGQTTVWRSADIFTYPVDQTLDRETNQHFLLSEREYAIGFDCFAGRTLFNPLGGS